MQQESGYMTPSLRGVTTSVVTAGSENPIAFYLDGVYISSQAGAAVTLPDIDRVEVLKGPQGTLFGRNATGGAVQIISKAPSMVETGEITLSTGYYDGAGTSSTGYDLRALGYVSGPIINDKLAASIAFAYDTSDGYARNIAYGRLSPAADFAYGTDRLAQNDDKLIRLKFLFTPTDNLKVLVSGIYTKTETDRYEIGYDAYGGTALSAAELSFPGRITGSQPWQYAFDANRPNEILQTNGASMKIDLTLEPGTITSTSAYSYTKNQEWVDSDGSYIPGCLAAFACDAPYDFVQDRDFSQEVLFSSNKLGKFQFVAGANYYVSHAEVDVDVNDFTFGAPPVGNAINPPLFFYDQFVKTKALGLFVDGNYEITDALTLDAGIRFSNETKEGFLPVLGTLNFANTPPTPLIVTRNYTYPEDKAKKWTPRTSLRYALSSESNVYFTYSQGFKSGVIPGGAPGSPVVKPEQIDAYEVGFKTAASRYSFDAAAFYYDYSDLQVQTNGGAGGTVGVIQNAAKARIYGLDVDGAVHVTDELSLHSGISWLPYAKYTEYKNAIANLPAPFGGFVPNQIIDLSGTRMFKTPKVTLSFGATYQVPVAGGTLDYSPNLYYASTLYTDPTHLAVLSTDNFKLGMELGYQPNGKTWRVALWGRNLTNDSSYVSVQTTTSGIILIPGEPRELGLKFSNKF
jgi:iron complex outermembrane receptor protein